MIVADQFYEGACNLHVRRRRPRGGKVHAMETIVAILKNDELDDNEFGNSMVHNHNTIKGFHNV
ncbi:hypothetical protein FRX31_017328 [Thalictrum thalictroides]|uniref:Uncharacterized protein n=1 Tax=Thalictrum thalictroides TaxID=46969 RepID=A0A7J6W9L9_THATH|nr:hypothetical protein FRX31_017328 [Thalictrum thalictroides]